MVQILLGGGGFINTRTKKLYKMTQVKKNTSPDFPSKICISVQEVKSACFSFSSYDVVFNLNFISWNKEN